MTGPQGGGGSFNFTDAIDTHGDYVVWMLHDDARARRRRRRRRRRSRRTTYAEHCREADIATAPLRDCLSYYNGHGEAAPGSLAYYGGGGWHKWRARRPRRRWSPTSSRADLDRTSTDVAVKPDVVTVTGCTDGSRALWASPLWWPLRVVGLRPRTSRRAPRRPNRRR